MTSPQTELIEDLRQHIYETASVAVLNPEQRVRWVMNQEWANDCRKLELEAGPAFWNFDQRGEYMLGIPIEVRDDGGVPHLEPVT